MPAACASPEKACWMTMAFDLAAFKTPYVSYATSTGAIVAPLSREIESKRTTWVSTIIAVFFFMISEWLFFALAFFAAPASPYKRALPGYHFQFPRDHFEHPDFLTEWWYYTGNVRTTEGKRFGFELVFFRQAERRGPPDNSSAWRIDDLYLAHLAMTDVDEKRFVYRQRLNRAGPGIAGASFAERRVWNGNWSARWDGERQTLEAVADDIRFHLQLTPVKPPVIHGENGVSRKGAAAGKASHYVSFPRLAVKGRLNGLQVDGTAWMDHEWFTRQLESTQRGWDWFSAQLADGADLMLLRLRDRDGSINPYSAGTYIDAQGRGQHLRRGDFELTPLEFWLSEKTKSRYPIKWRMAVPKLGIVMQCTAALANQELVGEHGGPDYWEGAVRYSGSPGGIGYLEMTGYDKPGPQL
jgi:predicted secreted hydrolase